MKDQTLRFPAGKCSCKVEHPTQGELVLEVATNAATGATVAGPVELLHNSHVDLTLQFASGRKMQLLAQVVHQHGALSTDKDEKEDKDDAPVPDHYAEPADTASDEVKLHWIHSGPLGKDRLRSMLSDCGESDGGEPYRTMPDEEDTAVTEYRPESLEEPKPRSQQTEGKAIPRESGVVVRDQVAPKSKSSAATVGAKPQRKSFKFAHMVRGKAQETESSPSEERSGDTQGEDVAASLRKKAKMVRASDLAARHDKVRVVNESTVKELIQAVVSEAAERMTYSLAADERQRLLEEAEESFQEKLEAFQAEKRGLETQTKVLGRQLDNAQSLLNAERKRVVSADQFTVSDAGMIKIEARLGRLIDRAARDHGISTDVDTEMRRVVTTLLDEERDKISTKTQKAQSHTIELLERKIQRLANSLETTQHDRDIAQRRAQALEEAGGVGLRNVLTVGLNEEDPRKETKLELLKEIFTQNQAIRQHARKLEGGSRLAEAAPILNDAVPA